MKPLSITDTSVLKGIAILMMLFHHAFLESGYFVDFSVGGSGIISSVALQFKCCVSIFVFLSGYGLTRKYHDIQHVSLYSFYRNRFVKLMLNYWFIWLIFVPLSVFCLSNKIFGWGYGAWANNSLYTVVIAMLDFLGIMQWFGGIVPYNPNWWFYACIIGLYILFPLLLWLIRRSVLFTLGVSVAVALIPGFLFSVVRQYLLVFLAGMLCARVADCGRINSTPPDCYGSYCLQRCSIFASRCHGRWSTSTMLCWWLSA